MKKIGKYEVREELGRGGMGVVYRAYDSMIDREVAIKVISELALEHAEIKERFYREARTAGRLSHDNITVVYDVGESEGKPYIVMEYLTGKDLRSLMDSGVEFSLFERLECAYQVCRALAYSHSRDIIHRDIKPGNVRILDDGKVKIMDFGIAKPMSSNLTSTGQVMGTPFYMSPEQIRGQKVDKRSDMFSFGVLFYEMLTNKLPFTGDQPMSVMFKIVHEEPEPMENIDPRFADSLKAVVMKSLQKKPDDRYQFFDEVATDLDGILNELRGDAREKQMQNRAKAVKLLQESEALLKKSAFQKAIEIAQRAKSLDPNNSQILKMIGQIQEAERKEEQRKLLEKTIAEAKKQLQEQDFDGALRSVQEALKLSPKHEEAERLKGDIEAARKKHEEEARVASLLSQARDAMARREYDSVDECVEKILKLRPKEKEATKLRDEVAAARKAAAASLSKREKIDALWHESTELFNRKDYKNAIVKLKALVELAPGNLQAWKLLEIAGTEVDGSATRVVTPAKDAPQESGETVVLDKPFEETRPFEHRERETRKAKVEPPPKRVRAREPRRSGKTLYVALAAVGLLVGAYIGYLIINSSAQVAGGSISINALPWAEVTKIESSDGQIVSIEEKLLTPCRVSLPAGRYNVHLSNPDYHSSLVVSVTVQEEQNAVVKETMPGFDYEQILTTF